MDRVILHSDLNHFFAAVECLHHPEWRELAVAVCGDPQMRHGIVLAKTPLAKHYGVKTGEAIWQAKQKCPHLKIVAPQYALYQRYAYLARQIYADYTDQVEPFGMDESWLDVTRCHADGVLIADEIRQRIRRELGLTVSIGVSWNKIFAKLGSDMKKPDATTSITRDNYRALVWPLPVQHLLFVGPSTQRKLARINIRTIGDLAALEPKYLQSIMGKHGLTIWQFANGLDLASVRMKNAKSVVKSIGNSTTAPRDLVRLHDVKLVYLVLAGSVASRLRDHQMRCRTVQISVRDADLCCFERQMKLPRPTQVSTTLAHYALLLFQLHYRWPKPVRSIGIRACDLVAESDSRQLSFFPEDQQEQRGLMLDQAMDQIRERYGHFSIGQAVLLCDQQLTGFNPKHKQVLYPRDPFNG